MRLPLRLLTLALVALAATALLTAACGDDDDDDTGGDATNTSAPTNTSAATQTAGSSEAQDITVTAKDFAFDFATISAEEGQTVNITLKNEDSAEHSFTVGSEDVTEAEGGEESSGSFTATSSTTEFHCKYHPSMKGTITIGG